MALLDKIMKDLLLYGQAAWRTDYVPQDQIYELERKYKMSQIKAGDRVRVVKGDPTWHRWVDTLDSYVDNGVLYTVDQIDEERAVRLKEDENKWWFPFTSLELQSDLMRDVHYEDEEMTEKDWENRLSLVVPTSEYEKDSRLEISPHDSIGFAGNFQEWSHVSSSLGEVDPLGKSAKDSGSKLDAGKIRMGLVLGGFARALQEVARVGTFGANKYTDNGWMEVPNGVNRYTDALYRHLNKEAQGEVLDQDSKMLHAAHAAWNALARLDLMVREAQLTRGV